MKHFGDITKLNGHDLPIVDIITGGSPCQDLSVAGKREGLSGARSGLFMEQIRIVKEMRDESVRQLRMRGADVDFRLIKPRFMVWENVPGAFSSNKGEDFRIVLEEICRIKDKDATIPMPEKGKWSTSGCIVGDGYSVAWRVHDAQFWGVPQRRKRIALVADFGGESAPEILFERKGVSGDIKESGEEGQGVAGDTERGIDKASRDVYGIDQQGGKGGANYTVNVAPTLAADSHGTPHAISFQERAGKPGGGKGILIQNERTGALSTSNNQSVCYGISSYDSNTMKSSNPHSGIYEANTTRTLDNNGGNPACNQGGMIVLEGNGSRPSHKGDGYKESDVSYTLNSTEQHAVCFEPGSMSRVGGHYYEDGKSGTLRANAGDNQQAVVHGVDMCAGRGVAYFDKNISPTHCADGHTNAIAYKNDNHTENHPADNIENQNYTLNTTDRPTTAYGFKPQQGAKARGMGYQEEVAPTLNTSMNAGVLYDKCVISQSTCYGLDRASFNQGQNAKYDFSVEEEKAQTLVARGPGGVMTQNCGTVGALCASDCKGVGNQYVNEGKCIVQYKR